MSNKLHTSSFVATALLLAGLVAIFVSQRILVEGDAQTFALYGGMLLALSALGLRTRAWLSTVGDVRAVEARLLGAYAGVALALALYALSSDVGLKMLPLNGETGFTAERAGTVLNVIWVAIMLVSLCAIMFMELVYLRMPIAASVELRRVQTALHSGVSLALSMVFLASVNFVANERDVRTDVSYFRTSEPSAGTRAMIAKLDKPLRVIMFFAPGSDALDQARPYFAALATENKKLSVKVKDVALSPELATKYQVRDNGQVLLLHGQGANEKGELFTIGSGLTEARSNLRQLDGNFQQSFRKLMRPTRSLFLTVGHGERNSTSSNPKRGDGTLLMQDILVRLNLKIDTIGVSHGLGHAIPEAAGAVAIIGPTQPFLPEEVATLLGFVRKGGKLFLMLDPDKDVGLQPLLAGIGLALSPGTVLSKGHHMTHAHNESDSGVIYSNSYTSHPIVTTATRNQREVATVFVNGVALIPSTAPVGVAVGVPAEPKPKVTFPLRSARDFWRDLNGDFKQDANEKSEALNLIAAVTLSDKSPDKSTDKAKGTDKGNDDTEGRAVVVGDGDFMTDKLASNNGNLLVFVDSLAWLIGNEDLSGEVNSEEDVAIEHTRQEDKVWFYATTFGMPAPIALLGFWVTRRRRLRAEARS